MNVIVTFRKIVGINWVSLFILVVFYRRWWVCVYQCKRVLPCPIGCDSDQGKEYFCLLYTSDAADDPRVV